METSQWFQRRCHLKMWTDAGRTDAGRPAGRTPDGRTPDWRWTTDGERSQKLILSTCSGELKSQSKPDFASGKYGYWQKSASWEKSKVQALKLEFFSAKQTARNLGKSIRHPGWQGLEICLSGNKTVRPKVFYHILGLLTQFYICCHIRATD